MGLVHPASSYSLNFPFVNSNNEEMNLSIYSGNYLFIDAFATWCEACKTEMRYLLEVYEAVGDQIMMLSLSVDPDDTVQKINEFKDEFNAPWDFGLDHKSLFLQSYPVIDYPTHYFFDLNGEVLRSWTSITTTSKFLNDLDEFVDVPQDFEPDDEVDVYTDEIFSNPLILISFGFIVLIIIYNLTRRIQNTSKY